MASDSKHHEYFPELSSQQDVNRLRDMHRVLKHCMNGKLVLAPIDLSKSDLRILDACTSDGYWLFDLRNDIGTGHGHTFIGVDIDATRFPSKYPEDVTLQAQDTSAPWPSEWRDSFDLVHQRFGIMVTGKNPHDVLHLLLSLVKPGGWIQIVEPNYVAGDGDPLSNQQYLYLVREVIARQGNAHVLPQLRNWIEEAGFVNVKEDLVTTPMGAKISDPEFRELNVESMVTAIDGIVSRVKCKYVGALKVQL